MKITSSKCPVVGEGFERCDICGLVFDIEVTPECPVCSQLEDLEPDDE